MPSRQIWASSKRARLVRKTRELWKAARDPAGAWGLQGLARQSPRRARAAPNILLQASFRRETGLARGCKLPPARSALRDCQSDADSSAILYLLEICRRLLSTRVN